MIQNASTTLLRMVTITTVILFNVACSDQVDPKEQKYFYNADFLDPVQEAKMVIEVKDITRDKDALMIAGSDINAAISDLEKIERYRKPRILQVKDENMAGIGLGKRVFVDWSGPIEPLMAEVAAYSDYKLKVLGVAPAIPLLVTVVHQDIEVGDIVREAHLQAKARADVVIYPKSKTIEIRYFEMG